MLLVTVTCSVAGVLETMFLRAAFKILGRFFHRKCSSKRPRNLSTFQECMEPEQSRGYWKLVLFFILLVSIIFYMFFFRGSADYKLEPFNESMMINEQRTATDSVTGDIILIHKKYAEDGVLNVDELKTKKPKRIISDSDGLPLCTAVTVNTAQNLTDSPRGSWFKGNIDNDDPTYVSTNISDSQYAMDLDITIGGHYVPKECRPRHKVAILIPYWWNRKRNLKIFLYYIHPFLIRQRLEYRIFLLEQHGEDTVNIGRLYNAGFLEIQKNDDWQCVVFHDVNLLPADDRIRYTCPVLPRHMCASILGKEHITRYNTVFGGVTAMTMWHYKKANGYSNFYWGRGESEDMFKRLQAAGLGVTRYKKDIAKYISLKHSYSPDNPDRARLLATAEERYKDDGLSTLQYNVASYASFSLYTHIVVNVNDVKNQPDYITEASITLSP